MINGMVIAWLKVPPFIATLRVAQRLCIYLFSEQVCDCINENSASQRAAKRKYGGPNPGCGRPGVRKEKKFGIFYLPLDKEN